MFRFCVSLWYRCQASQANVIRRQRVSNMRSRKRIWVKVIVTARQRTKSVTFSACEYSGDGDDDDDDDDDDDVVTVV